MGKREEKRQRRWGCIIPVALTAALLFWIPLELHLSNNVLKLEETAVYSDRLPASFDGFRVLHLSDLHEKTFGEDNGDLLGKAKKANPDIIAVTGDLIDSEEGLAYAEKLLPELAVIAPTYYVTGNHEWAADGKTAYLGRNRLIARLERIVADSGAVWLDSTYIELKCRDFPRLNCQLSTVNCQLSIILAGLCDPNGPRAEPDAGDILRRISETHNYKPFTLLLSHRQDMDYIGFDVVLAGHAHGGVVRLPFTDGLIGPDREWFPKGTSGILRSGGAQVVVSRGLGDTYAPRFLNRPQVLAVELRVG